MSGVCEYIYICMYVWCGCVCTYLEVAEAVPSGLLVGQGEQASLQVAAVLVLVLLGQVSSAQVRSEVGCCHRSATLTLKYVDRFPGTTRHTARSLKGTLLEMNSSEMENEIGCSSAVCSHTYIHTYL